MRKSFVVVILLSLIATLASSRISLGAVVVLGNFSQATVTFQFAPESGVDGIQKLKAGESRPFQCGKGLELASVDGKAAPLLLNAYDIYLFVDTKQGVELRGIELAGKADGLTAAPVAKPPAFARKITVKLLADDTERRPRRVWEALYRKRIDAASEILQAYTGYVLEVVAVEEWSSDENSVDVASALSDFERAVKPNPAMLAISYTSRRFELNGKPNAARLEFSAGTGFLGSHILLRDLDPRNEPERIEVLVSELGKFFGAVTSPDQNSAMRAKLGDGKANLIAFRIGFDPLNTLAMNIVGEDLATGKLRKLGDLGAVSQIRLGRIYGTLMAATPESPLPDAYLSLLDRAGVALPEAVASNLPPGAAPSTPRPTPTKVAKLLTPKEEAVRSVILAVAQKAAANAKLPAQGAAGSVRIRGDELTRDYLKIAAETALKAEPDLQRPAFLIGVGLALDDSTILRDNPLTASFCKTVETDEERRERVAVLNSPTIHHRRDLCQHFVVSIALTELTNPELAERAGLLKEQLDMNKASGFSFSDLCADAAGVEFAKRIQADPTVLKSIAEKFTIESYIPKIDGLRDGLSAERFKLDYGSISDPRFVKAYAEVKSRVAALAVYK